MSDDNTLPPTAAPLESILKQKTTLHESLETEDKILFTGLDNSGKTSIIYSLKREISQIALLKPTRQAQRQIFKYLGKQISEWDLGGQERYRIAYLKEPTKFFDKTSVCIYTIDIQDFQRFDESLSYFSDVLDQFKKLETNPYIFIFFHKADPEYLKLNNVHIRGKLADLKDRIRKLVNEEFEVTFFETTIYELWSIISSFSQILLRLYPLSELLDQTITEFSEKVEADAAIVLDQNSLVIANYFKDEASRGTIQNSTPYFLTLLDSLDKNSGNSQEMNINRGDKQYFITRFTLIKSAGSIYLIIMRDLTKPVIPPNEIETYISMLYSLL
ncbi:MAG: ADP-ribosylation factor-like protein [Promethearchaeota archaeon]